MNSRVQEYLLIVGIFLTIFLIILALGWFKRFERRFKKQSIIRDEENQSLLTETRLKTEHDTQLETENAMLIADNHRLVAENEELKNKITVMEIREQKRFENCNCRKRKNTLGSLDVLLENSSDPVWIRSAGPSSPFDLNTKTGPMIRAGKTGTLGSIKENPGLEDIVGELTDSSMSNSFDDLLNLGSVESLKRKPSSLKSQKAFDISIKSSIKRKELLKEEALSTLSRGRKLSISATGIPLPPIAPPILDLVTHKKIFPKLGGTIFSAPNFDTIFEIKSGSEESTFFKNFDYSILDKYFQKEKRNYDINMSKSFRDSQETQNKKKTEKYTFMKDKRKLNLEMILHIQSKGERSPKDLINAIANYDKDIINAEVIQQIMSCALLYDGNVNKSKDEAKGDDYEFRQYEKFINDEMDKSLLTDKSDQFIYDLYNIPIPNYDRNSKNFNRRDLARVQQDNISDKLTIIWWMINFSTTEKTFRDNLENMISASNSILISKKLSFIFKLTYKCENYMSKRKATGLKMTRLENYKDCRMNKNNEFLGKGNFWTFINKIVKETRPEYDNFYDEIPR